MASTWGTSWGTSWAVSWNRDATPPAPETPQPTGGKVRGYDADYWQRKKKERDDELDAIIRQSIESIVTAEEPPKSKVKKKARRVFKRFVVEDKIDFVALEAAAQVNQNLLSVYNALIQAIQEQIEADRMAQYEDDFILLMLSATTVNPIKFH